MEKHIITYFETTNPTTGNTISAGYNIGQHWFNSTTGVEYTHKSDGVWVGSDGYSTTGHTHSQYLNLTGGTLTGGLTGTTITTTGNTTSNDFMSTSLNRTLTEVGFDTKINTGVPYSERQKFKVTVSSGTTITASLSFVGANTSFSYYINDKKFTVTSSNISAYTATGTSAGGTWFFYINNSTANVNSPIMVLTKTPWAITDPDVLLWNFYVDGTNNSIAWVAEERHTAGRDIFNHARNHAEGAVYNRGFSFSQYNGLTNTTLASNTDPNFGRAHVQISNGSFFDEDIKNNISHSDTSIGSTTDNPSTDWNLTVSQYLGFNDTNTSTVAGTITFATPHTFIAGQSITVMVGSTTAARGTFTINVGGTGTSFAVTTVTGANAFANGDIVVVGARIPIYYINSVAGSTYSWKRLATTDFLGVTSGAAYTTTTLTNGIAQYNNPTGGFTVVTTNRYYPVYLIATNMTSEPIIAVLGQGFSSNATLATALNENAFQYQNLVGLTDLGIQEIVPFMRLTYLYNQANTYRIRVVNSTFLNIRNATISGSFFGATAPQTAASTAFSPYGNITGSTVQAGMEQLADIKLNKTGGVLTGDLTVIGNVSGTTFYGDGSGLTNIAASGVTGLNLDRITSGTNSAVMSASGLTVNTGATITGNLTIVDSLGNIIAEISDSVSDTLWDVLDTGGNIVFSVSNDGSIIQNTITLTGKTNSDSPISLVSIDKTSCNAIFFDFLINNTATGAFKTGTIICTQDGTNITYTQISTDDLNNVTTGVVLTPQIISGNVVLVATITSGTWKIKIGVKKM